MDKNFYKNKRIIILEKDTWLIIILLSVSFVSVYYLPAVINRIVFLGILFAAYRTKTDYVYFAWFFLINNAPGRLFAAGGVDDVRIPLYPLVPGISLSFQDLFLILYVIKYLSIKRHSKFIFHKEFLYFLAFGFIVVLYSFLLGMNADSMILNFRALIPWSLVFIVPAYFKSKEIVVRVSVFIFPVVFLAFISLVYSYTTGNYLDYFLRGEEFRSLAVEDTGPASRSYSAFLVSFFAIVQAFYYYFNQHLRVNRNYLVFILLFGVLSILFTATRGWIIAIVFLLTGALVLLITSRLLTRVSRLIALSIIIIVVISTQIPILKKQFRKSYERFATLENLVEGDLTAGRTLSRLDVRGPRVMTKFWESPVFGWGFSDEYNKSQDSHVGNQNLLLSVGILGFIFVNGLFIHFCLKIYNFSKISKIRANEGKAPMIYLLGLLSVFIIHSSSSQFWGYNMGFDQLNKVLFLSFFFASINSVFIGYRSANYKILNSG